MESIFLVHNLRFPLLVSIDCRQIATFHRCILMCHRRFSSERFSMQSHAKFHHELPFSTIKAHFLCIISVGMLNNSKAIPQGNGGLPCNRCTHKSQTPVRTQDLLMLIFQDGGFPAFGHLLLMLYNFVTNKTELKYCPGRKEKTLYMY